MRSVRPLRRTPESGAATYIAVPTLKSAPVDYRSDTSAPMKNSKSGVGVPRQAKQPAQILQLLCSAAMLTNFGDTNISSLLGVKESHVAQLSSEKD